MKTVVRILTPLPNGMEPDNLSSVSNVMSSTELVLQYYSCHGPIIASNRNELIDIDRNFDYILFLDGDIIFDIDNIKQLLYHNCDVVSGNYVLRSGLSSGWCYDLKMKKVPQMGNGLQQVQCIAAGFALVRKSVFDRIEKPYFYYPIYGDKLLGEDVGFSYRCHDAGVKIMIDMDCLITHKF